MIYFIQDTGSGFIKIGYSHKPTTRLTELQTAQANQLALIAVMDGSRVDEHELHGEFKHIRGEWFEPTSKLLVFIRDNAVPISEPIICAVGKRKITILNRRAVAQLPAPEEYDEQLLWITRWLAHVNNGDHTAFKIANLIASTFPRAQQLSVKESITQMVHELRAMSKSEQSAMWKNCPDWLIRSLGDAKKLTKEHPSQ